MHASTLIVLAISSIGALAGPASAPCKNKGTVDFAGVKLETCKANDFEGETIKEFPGFSNIADCAKQCAVTENCQRAVWDSEQHWCLIKGSDSTGPLLKSSRYQTARVTKEIPIGTEITDCYGPDGKPYTSSTNPLAYTDNGIPYIACLNGDETINSYDIIGDVTDAKSCAKIVSTYGPGYYVGVWVSLFNACHVKPKDTNLATTFHRGNTRLAVATEEK